MSDNSKERKVSQANRELRAITLSELMVDVRADLLEVGIKAGLAAMAAMFGSDVDAICGFRYRHEKLRKASRWGMTEGEVVLGGRKVQVKRPRVRSCDGQELRLPSYAHFRDGELSRGEGLVVGQNMEIS
jgi:hypothetical protein